VNANVKKNAVVSLISGQEIDNQAENFKEPCKFPCSFFQNSSLSSPLKIGSSSNSGDTIDGIPSNSQNDTPSKLSLDQE